MNAIRFTILGLGTLAGVILVLLCGVALVSQIAPAPPAPPSMSPVHAVVRDETEGHIIRKVWACKSPATWDRTLNLAAGGDQRALDDFTMSAIAAGECGTLEFGRAVFVLEIQRDKRRALVRPQGGVQEWWVSFDGVSQ